MSNLRVVKYDPKTEVFSEETIEVYTDYYKLLECRTFDIVSPAKDINIFVDDEGLFKDGNAVSQINFTNGHSVKLAGILVFVGGVNEEGEVLSFKGDIEELKSLVLPTELVVGHN